MQIRFFGVTAVLNKRLRWGRGIGIGVLGSRAWEVNWEGAGGKAGSDDMSRNQSFEEESGKKRYQIGG